MDNFEGMIIKTYEPFYYDLSENVKLKCSITKGWEYMIDCEAVIDGKDFTYIVYNIDNGYNKPYERIQELVNELKKEFFSKKQYTLFDFI